MQTHKKLICVYATQNNFEIHCHIDGVMEFFIISSPKEKGLVPSNRVPYEEINDAADFAVEYFRSKYGLSYPYRSSTHNINVLLHLIDIKGLQIASYKFHKDHLVLNTNYGFIYIYFEDDATLENRELANVHISLCGNEEVVPSSFKWKSLSEICEALFKLYLSNTILKIHKMTNELKVLEDSKTHIEHQITLHGRF
jgi:hypothetical protein